MQIQKNFSLKPFNTFGMDVSAASFLALRSVEELKQILKERKSHNESVMMLGGGSNVLFTGDFDGLILHNRITGIDIIHDSEESSILKVGAGENWHEFVLHCIENNLGGVENLSLIPGTVGAAPMQNIGAYGVEIKDVFVELEALNRESLELETFTLEDCNFGYRQSVFKNIYKDKYFIVSVSLRLSKKHRVNTSYGAIEDTLQAKGIEDPTIKDVSDAVIQIRSSKLPDPKEIGNAGSFFKNPEISNYDYEQLKIEFADIPGYKLPGSKTKVPAAWLIQSCGWKGKRIGDIGVHKNQALVLVNYDKGKGADLKALSEDIRSSVSLKFGIELESEVNII